MGFSYRKIFLILSFFCLSNGAHAESLLSTFGNDMASPLNHSAIWITAAGTAATFATMPLDDQVRDQAVAHKPMGKYSRWGDFGGRMIPNCEYIVAELLASAMGSPRAAKRAEYMFRVSLDSAITTTILKYTTREYRPNGSAKRNSFPSGHATSAFAFASVVAYEHPWYVGVPAYAFAGAVGYSRINDNAHWLHDVVAGATVGIAYGIGIGSRMRANGDLQSARAAEERALHFAFVPLDNLHGGYAQFEIRR